MAAEEDDLVDSAAHKVGDQEEQHRLISSANRHRVVREVTIVQDGGQRTYELHVIRNPLIEAFVLPCSYKSQEMIPEHHREDSAERHRGPPLEGLSLLLTQSVKTVEEGSYKPV